MPLGVLAIGSFLQMVLTIWYLLCGCDANSAPHMLWNALLTPLACMVAVAWAGLRLTGLADASTAGGFGLCGLGLAARAECELFAWMGAPPAETVFGREIVHQRLLDVVRHTGLVAYVAGLALVTCTVVASSRRAEWRALVRRPVALAMAVVLAGCFVQFVVLLPGRIIPLLRP